ncbi:MAG: hypothetical protein NVS1B9_02030 [Solirubrobacteraceae bacterium]
MLAVAAADGPDVVSAGGAAALADAAARRRRTAACRDCCARRRRASSARGRFRAAVELPLLRLAAAATGTAALRRLKAGSSPIASVEKITAQQIAKAARVATNTPRRKRRRRRPSRCRWAAASARA